MLGDNGFKGVFPGRFQVLLVCQQSPPGPASTDGTWSVLQPPADGVFWPFPSRMPQDVPVSTYRQQSYAFWLLPVGQHLGRLCRRQCQPAAGIFLPGCCRRRSCLLQRLVRQTAVLMALPRRTSGNPQWNGPFRPKGQSHSPSPLRS